MSVTRWATAAALVVAAALLVFTASNARAQETSKKDSPEKARAVYGAETRQDAPLSDLTRVSTEQAAQQAVRAKADKKSNPHGKSGDKLSKTGEPQSGPNSANPAASGVVELQPASKSRDASPGDVVAAPEKNSPLKNIHGSVYGAMDSSNPAGHRTGAEVGAKTKSGKTSVYVKTEQGRSNPVPPQ